MKMKKLVALILAMTFLSVSTSYAETDGAVEVDTGYGFKIIERKEFETFIDSDLKIINNEHNVVIPSREVNGIIDKCEKEMDICFYDVTSEEEYIYEDYILAMQIIIVSEEEVTGTDNDTYYNIVETPFEHATMNLKLPVEIVREDKISVYSYTLPDTGRIKKEFSYDKSENSVSVNFSSEDNIIAVFYDEPPYNGLTAADKSKTYTATYIVISIAICALVIAAVIYIYRNKSHKMR